MSNTSHQKDACIASAEFGRIIWHGVQTHQRAGQLLLKDTHLQTQSWCILTLLNDPRGCLDPWLR